MSRLVPLTTMRDRVINLCDLSPTLDTTTSPTAAAMLDFLQVSATLLSGEINELATFHFATSTTLNTVANVALTSLPTDASNILRISWVKDESTDIPLSLATLEEMHDRPYGWEECTPSYRIVGQTIEFYPTPTAVYDIKLHYSTGLFPADINASAWCMDGWDQYIVLQTCLLVRARQQRAAPEFEGPLMLLRQSIRSQLQRDKFGVHVVRDLRGSPYDAPFPLDPRRWGG